MSPALSTLPKRVTPPGVTAPRELVIAAAVLAIEAAGTLAYGAYLLLAGAFWHPINAGRAEGAGFIVFVMGAGLALVAFGLTRARRWSRTPAAFVQTFGFWTSYYIIQAGLAPIGVLVILVCAATLVLLFTPRATRSFIHE